MTQRLKGLKSILLITVLNLFPHATICDRYCEWSKKSMSITATCPTRKDDFERASEMKGCESMAEEQNCTEKSKFRYHCVINELEDKLVEVCAPVFFIQGYCTEYNINGTRIQDHLYLGNGSVAYPFTSRYISTDAYKYPNCYALVNSTYSSTSPSSFLQTTVEPFNSSMDMPSDGDSTPSSFLQTTVEPSSSSMDMPSDGDTTPMLTWIIPTVTVIANVVCLAMVSVALIYKFCRKKMIEDPKTEHELSIEEGLLQDVPKENESDHESGTDDSSSTISAESATDIVASIRGGLLQDISRGKESADDKAASSEDNEQITKKYLNSLQRFDDYFVETNFCRKATETLQEEGVAVLTGKPGNGKTSTAVHIMLRSIYTKWVKQKFTTWSDFRLIDEEKNTLVFIDNIYDGNMYSHELDKWWDTFSNAVSESRRKSKGKVHILITAKENIIDKACAYMKRKTSVFREKFIIRTETYELSKEEKEAILNKQIAYAKDIMGIDPPKVEPEFIRELKTLNSVIGFPLCAHLYACVKDCRDSGIHFFQEPIQYLRKQIKYEIDVDRTGKVKSLFLVMFLHQIHVDTAARDVFESISLKDSKDCERYLEESYPNLIDNLRLKSNTFTKLSDVAKEMTKLNLITPVGEETFEFKHQTIFHAVGHYFFTEHFDVAVKYFPVEAFVNEEFVARKENEYDNMASRLYEEVAKGNHSKVFSSRLFKNRVFGEHFCKEIEKSKEVRRFLLYPGDHSLPLAFWVRKNHLFHLSLLIQDVIERHAKKDAELQFYLARFGECCADDENLLKKTDTTSIVKLEEARTTVLNYRNGEGKSVLHIIVLLEIPDVNVFTIVTHLLSDIKADAPSTVQRISDITKESLLTTVSKHTENSRILTILALLQNLDSLNVEGYLLIYNMASSFASCKYHCYLELEVLLRACIFLIYCNSESTDYRDRAVKACKNMKYDHVVELLSIAIDKKNQSQMSAIIDNITDTISFQESKKDIILPNPRGLMSPEMINTIRKCEHLLGEINFREICI